MSISVLILTKNEESDLPGCLKSVAWCDDVHVLDSISTDRTADIARAAGAHLHTKAFEGYASQRNAGLQLPFKHDWILTVDADERIPEKLVQEMQLAVNAAEPGVAAFRMRRRDLWWGTWLRHAQISPFYIRLTKKGRARYEREINEVPVPDGLVQDLTEHFDHYPFSKGLRHWIDKHNTYSSMEAAVILARGEEAASWREAFFGTDFNVRRMHQKRIFYKLPGRPLVKLFYMLFARRAVLDGWAGIRYSILQSVYEYFIVLKVKEGQYRQHSSVP